MEASHHHHHDEGEGEEDEDVQALSDSVSFHMIPIRIESFLAEPSTGIIFHTPLASLQMMMKRWKRDQAQIEKNLNPVASIVSLY